MWVFTYGSLMFEGWERAGGYAVRTKAELQGYSRVFNKASLRNWGTRQFPCPTLNLIRSPSLSCWGIAFQFRDERAKEAIAYLKEREGKGFTFPALPIRLDDGATAQAITSIYEGGNTIPTGDSSQIARMVMNAKGTSGPCKDYVQRVAEQLRLLQIDDPVVTAFSNALAGPGKGRS